MDENKFERGTSITIFKSDRFEDLGALILAFCIALGVVLFIGK